jgi:hypothetical protein
MKEKELSFGGTPKARQPLFFGGTPKARQPLIVLLEVLLKPGRAYSFGGNP